MVTKTIKLKEQVSRISFLSFVAAVCFYMITNAGTLVDEPTWYIWVIPSNVFMYVLKVTLYSLLTGLAIFFGVKNPSVTNLVQTIVDALQDGRLTPQEKLDIIEAAKNIFLSRYAEINEQVYIEKEKMEEPEPPLPT